VGSNPVRGVANVLLSMKLHSFMYWLIPVMDSILLKITFLTLFQSYYHHIKIIFPLTIHLYGYLIIVYLSYRFITYTLHDKHVEKHTQGHLVFYGHVLSLNRVQVARLLLFYCKTVFEINKLWQIERLDVVLVKMK
jgi:hypothetical protein